MKMLVFNYNHFAAGYNYQSLFVNDLMLTQRIKKNIIY